MVIFDFTEFEIKQAASDFCKTLSALSRSFSSVIIIVGSSVISLIINFPSTCSNFRFAIIVSACRFIYSRKYK